jgi:hypothetical protein
MLFPGTAFPAVVDLRQPQLMTAKKTSEVMQQITPLAFFEMYECSAHVFAFTVL